MVLNNCFIFHNILLKQSFKRVELIIGGISLPLLLLLKFRWWCKSFVSTGCCCMLILILTALWEVWMIPPSKIVHVRIKIVLLIVRIKIVLPVVVIYIISWSRIFRKITKQMPFSTISIKHLSNFINIYWTIGYNFHNICQWCYLGC